MFMPEIEEKEFHPISKALTKCWSKNRLCNKEKIAQVKLFRSINMRVI